MRDRLRRWLTHRRWPLAAALLAVVLSSPALGLGFLADDWVHRARLLDVPSFPRSGPALVDLFVFIPGDDAGNDRLREMALLPWWAPRGLRASFFRPLSVLTHQLDYALWPSSPAAMHAQSLLWLALAVVLVATLYRRLSGDGLAAGLGALLFALEDAHAGPAGWIANRNALIALAFSLLVLLLHDRWRREAKAWLALPAAVCFALALLAGEAALAVVPYLVGYALFLDSSSTWRRLASLVPYALLSAAWLTFYALSSYGTWGSDTYVDPFSARFVVIALERIPVLLLAQWTPLSSDFWIVAPRGAQILWGAAGAVLVGGLLFVFRPVLRERPEGRLWAFGMVGCLVPVCAAFPMDRLLLYCGVGAFGLLGTVAAWSGWPGPERRGSRPMRAVVAILLVLHLGLGLVLKPARLLWLQLTMGSFSTAAYEAPSDEAVRSQTLIFVNGMEFLVSYVWLVRLLEGGVVPEHADWLAHLMDGLEIRRTDQRTLVMRSPGGFLSSTPQQLVRSPSLPFGRGETFRRRSWTVTVDELTSESQPAQVTVRFDRPLEDPSYRWLVYVDTRLEPFEPPAVGESVTVEPSLPPMRLPAFLGGP